MAATTLGTPAPPVLKDVVAYVEVWSANGTENYSKTFTNQLVEMGAMVSKTFNKQVTHVVFKDGYQSTWNKAQKSGVKLVSVLWVEKCRTAGAHVDESLFPATHTSECLPNLIKKKRRCMQPKDFTPKTPQNDKRLQRKFEKMAKELQRQKKNLDDVPVLMFESNGSLMYSPTTPKFRDHHSAMEKRLQEMKEKRENLSPTSSQLIEMSRDNQTNARCEPSLNISHDSLCSGDSFTDDLHSSFNDLCGNQERRMDGVVSDNERKICAPPPALRKSDTHFPTPALPLSQLTPQKSKSDIPEEEASGQRGVIGKDSTPDKKLPERSSVNRIEEEKVSSHPLSAVKGHPMEHPRPKSSSKRKRSENSRSIPEDRVKRRYIMKSSVPKFELFQSEQSLQLPSTLNLDIADYGDSSYDDYFSPDNLKERNSKGLAPSPVLPMKTSCRRSLSKRERANILEMSDFSCIVENLRSGDITKLTAHASCQIQKPGDGEERRTGTHMAADQNPAAGMPEKSLQGGPPEREDGHPGGSTTHSSRERGPQKQQAAEEHWDPTPLKRSNEDPQGPPDIKGRHKEDTAPEVLESFASEAHSDFKPSLAGDSKAENAAEGRESLPSGHSGSVIQGPTWLGISDHSQEDFENFNRPQEESQRRGRSQKPTRTLVMTSMPSEQQNVVTQVVNKLQGFSLAPEVCDSTTHVLAGRSVRTLNVLLGIVRGCWILSYEWVLWSLEVGHWISEEPFELSTCFPAAPLCRLERQLSEGQYQGTLFAGQPTMFVSPASDPPKNKLWELITLSGGQVTRDPQQASIFIGSFRGKRKLPAKYLCEKWILDSITQHKVCDTDSYLLPQ